MGKTYKWWEKPQLPDTIPEDIDYIMFVDENGQSSSFESIKKKIRNNIPLDTTEKYLCLTGVVISVDEFIRAKNLFKELKCKNWQDGQWHNPTIKRIECVHIHSSDFNSVKNRRNAMRLLNDEQILDFMSDLTQLIASLDITVISSFIDNEQFIATYKNPIEVYHLATTFIFERFVMHMNTVNKNSKGIVVFESRKEQDKRQLEFAAELIFEGSTCMSAYQLRIINAIYFSPKMHLTEKNNSYIGIELADIVSYPVYKYCIEYINNRSFNRDDWLAVEKKLCRYPNYIGYGLKFFPKKRPPLFKQVEQVE